MAGLRAGGGESGAVKDNDSFLVRVCVLVVVDAVVAAAAAPAAATARCLILLHCHRHSAAFLYHSKVFHERQLNCGCFYEDVLVLKTLLTGTLKSL